MADIDDILTSSIEGNALEVQNAVNDIMQQKVADAINQMRDEIASSYFGAYGGDEDEEGEEEIEDLPEDDTEYAEDETEELEDDIDTSYEDSSVEDLLQDLEDSDDQENS